MKFVTDALGAPVHVGDTIAHVARCGSSIRITERTVLEIGPKRDRWDRETWTMTISPEDVTWKSGRNGHNVKGSNCVLVRRAEA